MYLVPLVGVVAALAYSQLARKRIAAAVASGHGPRLLHDAYAKEFDLNPDEMIVAVWQGVIYLGSDAGTSGGVASLVSWFVEGDMSTYSRPTVLVVLTTQGRLLLAEERTPRGYVEARDWTAGARAEVDPDAMSRVVGGPIRNPFDESADLELTILSGEGDDPYPVWLSTKGAMVASATWRRITDVLPTSPHTT